MYERSFTMRRLAILAIILSASLAHAQFGRGTGAYSTSGADAQRSSWVRSDPKISAAAMQKPGFAFLWKVKLNNEAKQMNSLTPAALMTSYIGYRGFRAYAFVGGSSDKIFAFDSDLGRVEWQKPLGTAGAAGASTMTC